MPSSRRSAPWARRRGSRACHPEVVETPPRQWLDQVRLDRLVYATVVLMSVLVVYDGWQDLVTFLGVALVIISPTVALAVAHFFAESMHEHAELERPLTRPEWATIARGQVSHLLAGVPALLVLGVGWVTPMDARGAVALLLWTGVGTLVVLSALAAYRAGISGWRLVVAALSGGIVGLIVISLQIVLKPH